MTDEDLGKIKELSHKINTPLTTVLGYASLMAKSTAGDKNAKQWLDSIKNEVKKISEYSKEINRIVTKELPD